MRRGEPSQGAETASPAYRSPRMPFDPDSAVAKKKKKAERAIAKKISLFHKIPDACMVCKEAFDKKNREQAFTWNVVVKREQGVVNLYCPSCWDHAMDVVKKHNPEEEHEV